MIYLRSFLGFAGGFIIASSFTHHMMIINPLISFIIGLGLVLIAGYTIYLEHFKMTSER